ncbi:FAD-dependent oxidoreductase [Desulfobacterales bacterium HSG16]|nr:FAD-dependent oxidoreductase [Desulfobacterales bacterium HSG16]
MKFVIIGGDAAGMSAASRAKRSNPGLDVVVLEKSTDVSYSACGMPYNIADPDRDIEELVVRQAEVFRKKQGINVMTGHNVESIDPAAQTVSGTSAPDGTEFEFSYDKLLIATGGSSVMPDISGFDLSVSNQTGIMALKTLDDGRKIKAYLKEKNVKKVIIIGMGYIGLEMCEALRERSIEVDMVKPGPVLLPNMEQELSDAVREELESNDVRLYPGHQILSIEKIGERLKLNCPDISLDADMVLSAIGIRPNSEIAAKAGLKLSVGNSIAVDRKLVTSDENIYAAGDCADAFHIVTGERTWIPLALRANRAGWAVADNVCGKTVELAGISGTAIFKVFDLEVARTGLTIEEAENSGFDPAKVVIKTRSRAHAHPGASIIRVQMIGDKKTGRLLGCQMVGREGVAHRISALAVALHSQMTVEEFSQTDMAYAPPFGPVWDPLLTAANQLLKKM